MGCHQSKSRVYIAPDSPQKGGEHATQSHEAASPASPKSPKSPKAHQESKEGAAGAGAGAGVVVGGLGGESATPPRAIHEGSESMPASGERNPSDASSTHKLAVNQLSRSCMEPPEARVLERIGSHRVLMQMPTRLRRASIVGVSYPADSPLPTPPVFKKTSAQKRQILDALSRSFLFDGLGPDELAVVVDAMQQESSPAGSYIITQGDTGDKFYLLSEGTVTVEVEGCEVSTLERPSHFGELALMYDCPRNASIVAKTNCDLWALDRDTFRNIIVKCAREAITDRISFLQSCEIVKSLPRRDLSRLAHVLFPFHFNDGDTIIEQGTDGSLLYFVKTGKVSVFKLDEETAPDGTVVQEEVEVMSLPAGSYFGEQALIHKQKRAASVRAIGTVECLAVHQEFFDELLSPLSPTMLAAHSKREMYESRVRSSRRLLRSLDTSMESPASGAGGGTSPTFPASPSHAATFTADIKLNELSNVAILGEGAFGMVRLVKHQPTNSYFALKVMQKARIVDMAQQRNVVMEKNIMLRATHPYILKLYKTFKDRDCVYMLLEFCQGGDMFTLLSRQGGKLTTPAARHYGASVASVLGYLHARHVVYRDLKPENLVFDHLGHLKVVDFGFAKIVKDRTYTLCGTPEYLAPELVQCNGHNHGVDYWALGILIYEMLVGYSPFADHANNNQLVIYKNIVAGKISFPSALDSVVKDLIRRLLSHKVSRRLGCGRSGLGELKAHPWFEGFDWEGLLAMRLPPPHPPTLSGPVDLTLFDQIEDPGPSRILPYHGDGTDWDKDF